MDPTAVPRSTRPLRRRSRAGRMLQVVAASLGAGFGLVLLVSLLVRPWSASWGATAAEVHTPLPGDELVPNAASQVTRAIDIEAAPSEVWPWLVQMGVDRAGLYSYTWIENSILRLGVENSDRIHPEWQDLQVGDIIAFTPADYPGGQWGPQVVTLVPNAALVLCYGTAVSACTATWQLVLVPQADGATRLLVRARSNRETRLLARVPDLVLEPGTFLMERKMLLGIKERAERSAA